MAGAETGAGGGIFVKVSGVRMKEFDLTGSPVLKLDSLDSWTRDSLDFFYSYQPRLSVLSHPYHNLVRQVYYQISN